MTAKLKLLIGASAALVILSTVAYLFIPNLLEQIPSGRSKTAGDSCEGNEFFTVSPAELTDFTEITPLGNFAPPSHTFPTRHMYFHVRRSDPNDPESVPAKVPLVAPGKIRVTEIRSSTHLSEDPAYTDYSIIFSSCQELTAYFNHVSSLSDKLMEAFNSSSGRCSEYETGGKRYRSCDKSMEIELSAGEILGPAGGIEGQNAFDLGATDYRINALAFANPARWGNAMKHAACPLDYFSSEVKTELYSRVGTDVGYSLEPRTVEPVCGQVEQDELGTAQGVWFVEGTKDTYPEDQHLALAHDNFDPTRGVFSVGQAMQKSGLSSNTYYFDPEEEGLVNRDFSDIKPDGEVYCFETKERSFNPQSEVPKTVIILELTSDTAMRMEKKSGSSCGTGPWSFSSQAAEFER